MAGFTDGPGGSAPVGGGYTGGGAGLIGTILELGGTIYASQVAKRNTDKTNQANRDLSELGYQHDVDMWNRQNEYNSPAAQMARLKAAGLNPNLIYGSGAGGAAGNSSQLPHYSVPQAQYNYRPMVDLPQLLGAYQEFSMRQAQIDNVKAQTENTRSRTLSEGSRNFLLGVQGKMGEQSLSQKGTLFPYQTEIAKQVAEKSKAGALNEWKRFALLNQDEQLKALQQMYLKNQVGMQDIEKDRRTAELLWAQNRNELMKMGVTTGDNYLLRILARMLNESGLDPATLFK